MATLTNPGWGITGWDFTKAEEECGRVWSVEIACEDSDEQVFMEKIQEYEPGALVHVANFWLSAKHEIMEENHRELVIPESRESLLGRHGHGCSCMACSDPDTAFRIILPPNSEE